MTRSQCDRGDLERDLNAKVKRQISWKITLAAAVQRKEESLARKRGMQKDTWQG